MAYPMLPRRSHARLVVDTHSSLTSLLKSPTNRNQEENQNRHQDQDQHEEEHPINQIILDGNSLTLASVSAVAHSPSCSPNPTVNGIGRGKATVRVNVTLSKKEEVRQGIEKSVHVLREKLEAGDTVYGVNTGYGGSADVRCESDQMVQLQRSFLQHLHVGVLPLPNTSQSQDGYGQGIGTGGWLKEEWVRASMVVRGNSVARGHSAVRISTIESLLALLNKDIIPLIPLRGSISASGDLSPLSYIAGVLEGNPYLYCWTGPRDARRLVSADQALAQASIEPVVFQPKEALGLVNGTAISSAVGGLVLKSVHNTIALSQILTAMNVEAILGTTGSFAPFISQVRPHPGQAEVASTILAALEGSRLATPLHGTHGHTLFQDRYSLRTVPQWLGPFLEDLLLAHDQLTVEMNSTTDNPLIDPYTGQIHHGGNFQAVSVTSAMEKSRLAAQAIGRMLFAQFTELTNHATNRGLPPNLCADDPSTSFTFKGVDTAMASYMSELSFLANPVHNHVVSAEMGNQALNSLALISARYTDTSVDILALMCASALYANCQALDLRAMLRIFEERLNTDLHGHVDRIFSGIFEGDELITAKIAVSKYVKQELDKTTSLDANDRFEKIMAGAKAPLLESLPSSSDERYKVLASQSLVQNLRDWSQACAASATRLYSEVRDEYIKHGDASPLLGKGTRRLYNYVRNDLRVPMHRGLVDHPTFLRPGFGLEVRNGIGIGIGIGEKDRGNKECNGTKEEGEKGEEEDDEWRKKSIGHWISVIHDAIKDERIMDVVVECLRDGLKDEDEV